jgi:hypothetical protein
MNLIQRLHDPALPYSRLDPRREATHGLVALMEAMWIAPWFAVFLPAAAQMPVYALLGYVGLNILAALLIVRLLDARGVWENLRQVVFVCGLFLAVFWSVGVVFPVEFTGPAQQTIISDNLSPVETLVIPPFVPILLLTSIVWWRGLRLAITSPTPTRVAFGMRLGILFFFGVALAPDAQAVTLAAIPPFFFFGLLAISLARAIALRETGGSDGARFGSRWSAFMIAAAGGITLVGFVISAVLGGMDPDLIASVVQPIIGGLLLFFSILMTPIFLVLQAVIEFLVRALAPDGVGNVLQVPTLMDPIQQGDQPQTGRLDEAFQQVQNFFAQFGGLPVCITVVIVVIIVLVIVLTLRRQQRAALGQDEEREDIEGDALGSLADMFRRGFGALNNAFRTVGQFGLGRDLFAALTIRRVYAQMARLAEKEGYPRAASETPYEYRSTLRDVFPHVTAEIDTITEAYVRVHYGEVPEDDAALQNVVAALDRLKKPAPAN